MLAQRAERLTHQLGAVDHRFSCKRVGRRSLRGQVDHLRNGNSELSCFTGRSTTAAHADSHDDSTYYVNEPKTTGRLFWNSVRSTFKCVSTLEHELYVCTTQRIQSHHDASTPRFFHPKPTGPPMADPESSSSLNFFYTTGSELVPRELVGQR